MAGLKELWRGLLFFLRRGQLDRDLEEEMRLHQELRAQAHAEEGLPEEEARYRARREYGNALLLREKSRDAWGFAWLETLLQDLRYGLRQLRRNPGFTVVAVLTLALGIGANTAIFTLVDKAMLKSLPVARPNQLYGLGNWENCCVISGFQNDGWGIFSYALYGQLRDHTPEFSDLAAFQAGRMQLSVRRLHTSAPAKPFWGEFVSGNYFRMFGIGASAGRILMPTDDRANSPRVAVMSYHAWQQDFGLDRSVIGATYAINSVPYTVVGITPKGFFGDALRTDPPDFWLPLGTEPVLKGSRSLLNHASECWLYAIGRLKPGAQPQRVQSRLTVEMQQWLDNQSDIPAQYRKEISKQYIQLTPAGAGVARIRSYYANGLELLMILAGVVLLIACANIANLLLARGAASRLSAAVRAALGAPRRRLVRQVLTETILLAALGGLAGLFVAYVGARAILLLSFRGVRYVPLSPNPSLTVLGFAFALSLLTGVLFGLAPAWVNSRSDPAEVLRGAGPSASDRSSLSRRALVVLQVALCMVLLASAGLLTESLGNLEHQHFNFETRNRWAAEINPALAGYKPGQLYGLYKELERRLSGIPGVVNSSYSQYGPVDGGSWSSIIHVEGQSGGHVASWMRVGPHYFETIGTPVIRGRTINDQDTPTSRRVAVINQAFAQKFFPHLNPLGKHFGIGSANHAGDYEVVGVVADARSGNSNRKSRPEFFLPYLQMVSYAEQSSRSVQLRSNYVHNIELQVAGRPENLLASVRSILASVNPNLTVLNMMSFGEQLSLNFNQDRLMARITALFGLLALILACIGLYGVTAYSVTRRTHEIGIRMALGAQKSDVLRMVAGQGLKLALIGIGIGVVGAFILTRFLSSLLYGVKPTDPLTFIAVSLTLVAVALLACYIPARRAAKVDPMVALRYE